MTGMPGKTGRIFTALKPVQDNNFSTVSGFHKKFGKEHFVFKSEEYKVTVNSPTSHSVVWPFVSGQGTILQPTLISTNLELSSKRVVGESNRPPGFKLL